MPAGKDLGALVGQIGADIRQWEKAARKIDRDLNKMQRKGVTAAQKMSAAFDHMSKTLVSAGRTMTRRVTLPLATLGGASLKMAADFEASFSKIEGLVGVAADETARMRQEVLAMGGEVAQTPKELADALFFITSAGLRGQEALDVLRASARAATAGLGEVKVVADLVTSAVNAYGSENLSAAMATDILTAAVREGKAEAPELASSLGQVLPVASQMGVTFDQVGAAVAAMTRTGTDAATASMQLRQILFKLLKPMTQSEEAARKMGSSTQAFRDMLRGPNGLVKVLSFLKKQMETNEQAMAEIFPNVRALAGALDLMGSNADENIAIFDRMTDTTGTLDKASQAAAKTLKTQFNQALADLQAEAIRFGNMMLPVAKKVVNAARDILASMSRMSDESRGKILALATALAVGGPLMFALGKLIKTVQLLASIATSKFTLIAGAGLLIVTMGKNLVDNWELIKANLEHLWLGMALAANRAFFRIANAGAAVGAISKEAVTQLSTQGAELRLQFDNAGRKVVDLRKEAVTMKESFVSLFGILGDLGDLIPSVFDTGGGGGAAETASLSSSEMLRRKRIAQFGEGIGRAALPVKGTSIELKKAAERADVLSIAFGKVTEVGEQLAANIAPMVGRAVSDMALNFIEGIVQITSAGGSLKNVFRGMLNTLADLAIRVGKIAIGVGVAIEAIKKALDSLQPAAAIAAGIALIALGAAAKAALSNAGDSIQDRRRGRSVDDALITSKGEVIELNPNDDVLAMQDLTKGLSMAGAAGAGMTAPSAIRLEGEFRVKGTDLVLTLERAKQQLER